MRSNFKKYYAATNADEMFIILDEDTGMAVWYVWDGCTDTSGVDNCYDIEEVAAQSGVDEDRIFKFDEAEFEELRELQ